MTPKLANLENLIGHRFADAEFAQRAVTHRSWAYENLPGETEERVREAENESMEFVGDSVLGLVIAERLYQNNPHLNEGDLTLMKHHLVSTATLAHRRGPGSGQICSSGARRRKDRRSKETSFACKYP